MSYGCGTLASPSGFSPASTLKASGTKQHGLPANPRHTRVPDRDDINEYWGSTHSKGAKTDPFSTKSELWSSGEFWNVDSNVRKWTLHEVKRNAAAANYGTHAPDQFARISLTHHEDERRKTERQPISTSGMILSDEMYMGAMGFGLGARDRQNMPMDPPWRAAGSTGQMFRGRRSCDRNVPRLAEYKRSLMFPGAVNPVRSRSAATLMSPSERVAEANAKASLEPLVHEDIFGESHKKDTPLEEIGNAFDSRSVRYWDDWGHCVRREGSRMAYSVMSPQVTVHREGFPVGECGEIKPAHVYTKKYQKAKAGALETTMDSLEAHRAAGSPAKGGKQL